MNLLPFIVCVYGVCLNPSQITYMETKHISGNCIVNFTGNGNHNITIEDHSCEDLSNEINKQLLEKTQK